MEPQPSRRRNRGGKLLPLGSCWLWTGPTNGSGYGLHTEVGHHRGLVHVIVWEALYGPVPDGYELDHVCRVRACSNPHHLEVVTRSENNRRRLPWARR